ncbi:MULTISPECIES: acyl carrier protein [Streptomyces]|uniref:acyl carrier protein n=1 Tax=Streptomyces TaxID=1883 RepID=UPI001E4E4E22|nr:MULTISPECIES: acyl carrier protein [Streptomyces]UFQ19072.1 acyl carrier protein [Streptomyces huasconensis]WCL88691.1 acyl carrier protein [Streptomyces sp. JCM 35825]
MEKLTLDALIELLNECNDFEDPVDPVPDVLDATFDALGFDSLTLLNAISKLERQYEIELPETVTSDAKTPRELLAVVNARLA